MAEELGPDQKHTASRRVRDPSGNVVSEVGGELAAAGEAARPEWLAGIMLAASVQFEATEEGAYMLEQLVDNASTELPIHIVHGLPPGMVLPDDAG